MISTLRKIILIKLLTSLSLRTPAIITYIPTQFKLFLKESSVFLKILTFTEKLTVLGTSTSIRVRHLKNLSSFRFFFNSLS